ncbi:MAG: hypothetical protein U0132_02710 [Gemmatimonadaceae bacterium]
MTCRPLFLRRAPRAGFALAELIVALTVLVIAVLSLAAVGGRLLALGQAAMTRYVAASATASLMDSLRAVPCHGIAPGSSNSPGTQTTWSVAAGTSSRTVRVTTTFTDRTVHTFQVEGAIPCE